jgi:hypothetical protein
MWTIPSLTKPLFTEAFCHPVEIKKGVTAAADLTMCIGKDAAACAAPCVFNNGADLIPTESFCAPRDMTKDVALIERCTNADKAMCVEPDCRWRKGKTVAKNIVLDTANKNLFESNFCHPPSTDNWDVEAPACLLMTTKVYCEETKKCVWSTGQQFAPDHDFCSAKEISREAPSFKACAEKKDQAICTIQDPLAPQGCKWNKDNSIVPVAPVMPTNPTQGVCIATQ